MYISDVYVDIHAYIYVHACVYVNVYIYIYISYIYLEQHTCNHIEITTFACVFLVLGEVCAYRHAVLRV